MTAFAQEEPVDLKPKVEEDLHLTAIEMQAHNRIVAHFTREISTSRDISKFLDEMSRTEWKQNWFDENKQYLQYLDDKSKNGALRSEYLDDFVPEIINCYFLVFQFISLSPEGADENIPEGFAERIKVDPWLFRLFEDESGSHKFTASELPLLAQSLKRLNSVLRTALVAQIKMSPEAVVRKFNKDNDFSKQPKVNVLREEKYGLPIGTRVINAENGPIILQIARVNGVYKVVSFYQWMGD